ncbi:MAG: D-alanyl-D-alanine carboxypeptidase, partial [Clostridiales bacterium]|nr:D-alanyl-D-alanine carboxypeptidase [Clostridiales bacterium]
YCLFMKKFRFIYALVCVLFCCGLLAAPAQAASYTPASGSAIVSDMEVNCGSCLLVEMNTDAVLYGQDNSEQIYPASVTKILTALVVLQHIEDGDLSLDTTVTASSTFKQGLTSQAALGNIQTGEQLTIKDLLYMLLLPSHCDAANVLAEAVSGSIEDFAAEMNETAAALGCTGSNFVNPSGLHNKNHYTTCDDLYRIAKAAYQYETFRTIIGTDYYTVPATNLSAARELHNTNALICDESYSTYLYDYCVGGKTGSTYLAGYCLLSYAEKDDKTLCCVMMGCNWLINLDGSRDRLQFSESVRLYEWGFENFSPLTLVEEDSAQASISVEDAKGADSVELLATDSLTTYLPNDLDASSLTYETDLPDSIQAPVIAGETVGTLTVTLDGVSYGTVDLVAAEDLERLPPILTHLRSLSETAKPFPTVAAILGGLVGLVLLFFLVQALRRRYHRWQKRRRSHRNKSR